MSLRRRRALRMVSDDAQGPFVAPGAFCGPFSPWCTTVRPQSGPERSLLNATRAPVLLSEKNNTWYIAPLRNLILSVPIYHFPNVVHYARNRQSRGPFRARMRARGVAGGCRDMPRWSFPAPMRDFQKLLVILLASACAGAAYGCLLRASPARSAELHAVYQALYAEGSEQGAACRLGQHALAGVLTNIFLETRTRFQNDHHRGPQHALGAKTTAAGRYMSYPRDYSREFRWRGGSSTRRPCLSSISPRLAPMMLELMPSVASDGFKAAIAHGCPTPPARPR